MLVYLMVSIAALLSAALAYCRPALSFIALAALLNLLAVQQLWPLAF